MYQQEKTMSSRQERDALAVSITRRASNQTYAIFRLFADRDRIQQAFRSYAYFRWVDDILDATTGSQEEKLVFVKRQRGLLDDLYNGVTPLDLNPPEEFLVDLVQSDPDPESGLYLYLDKMMRVMEFDADRRGKEISQEQLDDYVRNLAVSVTEILHYVIGHHQPGSMTEDRYHAVTAAHITHMLRDTLDDAENGYYNIPGEYLREHNITAFDVKAQAYQEWVCSRVALARTYFKTGRAYLSRLKNIRTKLAGFAYTARFEWMLRTIERENFCLRKDYPDRKKLPATIWMMGNTFKSIWSKPRRKQKYISLSQPKSEVSD
jgi:phytoene/squalene synthetase